MARPTSPKERQKQQQKTHAQNQQAVADKARKRRRTLGIIGLAVVLALVLGTIGAVIAGTTSSSDSATTTSSTTGASSTTVLPTGAAAIPAVDPGATLTEATPCPAEDGSSPRTTQFAGPPPTCIDLTLNYEAVVHTNVGDLRLLLATEQAPGAVNNFVVLARYHYFDGQAFAPIITKTLAAVAPRFTGSPTSPGYTLPSEVPPQGQVRGPYTVSALPIDSSGGLDGSFFITTFSNAPDLDVQPTTYGLVLDDGGETIKAINAAGGEDGTPTSAVIITGIEIMPSVPLK